MPKIITNTYLISAAKIIDGVGSLQDCIDLECRIHARGYDISVLTIEPLSADWHSELQPNSFRSGCGPIEALAQAQQLIEHGSHAVVITAEDYIKTGFSRAERLEKMSIYGIGYPLTEAYTELSQAFMQLHQIDDDQFKALASALFDNHQASYAAIEGQSPQIEPKWFEFITPLFRGVDCANPLVDFSGRLLLCSDELRQQLCLDKSDVLELAGVGLGQAAGDGKAHLSEISRYQHLTQAYQECCRRAEVDFCREFKAHRALLEVYTCYPVVPLAFLLSSGLVDSLDEVPHFLQQYPVTVTGGMNLARAAWNTPTLNALVECFQGLLDSDKDMAMVHGNGGLGYRQGVALLRKFPHG